MSLKKTPDNPSTFILYEELLPPAANDVAIEVVFKVLFPVPFCEMIPVPLWVKFEFAFVLWLQNQ